MKKKSYKTSTKSLKVSEPEVKYSIVKNKDIEFTFFKSFESMDEFEAKQRASLSYDQRMIIAEQLRKQVYHAYLKPDGTWPDLAKVFKIMPPYTSDVVR